jgi:hypothetical protein
MAMLEGTFNTPVGTVPKKAAVLIGGGVLLLVGVMYYRGKKMDSGASTAGASTEINPATGYVYGSPEDAAAMAAQGGYQTGGSVGGGGGGDPIPGTGFVNNAQWVQSTIAGMTNSGIITDASALSVALGKYIAGQPVGSSTTARSLIEQAIAFNGPPPLAGPNGYPPSINTQNPVDTPPPATTPPPAPAPATNPYINPDGTLSIGAGADLAAAAGSVGLTLSQLAALNPSKYPSNGTVTAVRGMPYRIK